MIQGPNMSDSEHEHKQHVVKLYRIVETFAKVKEFLEASGFTFSPMRNAEEVSPVRKAALSSWTNHYKSLVMTWSYYPEAISRDQPVQDLRCRHTED